MRTLRISVPLLALCLRTTGDGAPRRAAVTRETHRHERVTTHIIYNNTQTDSSILTVVPCRARGSCPVKHSVYRGRCQHGCTDLDEPGAPRAGPSPRSSRETKQRMRGNKPPGASHTRPRTPRSQTEVTLVRDCPAVARRAALSEAAQYARIRHCHGLGHVANAYTERAHVAHRHCVAYMQCMHRAWYV